MKKKFFMLLVSLSSTLLGYYFGILFASDPLPFIMIGSFFGALLSEAIDHYNQNPPAL